MLGQCIITYLQQKGFHEVRLYPFLVILAAMGFADDAFMNRSLYTSLRTRTRDSTWPSSAQPQCGVEDGQYLPGLSAGLSSVPGWRSSSSSKANTRLVSLASSTSTYPWPGSLTHGSCIDRGEVSQLRLPFNLVSHHRQYRQTVSDAEDCGHHRRFHVKGSQPSLSETCRWTDCCPS